MGHALNGTMQDALVRMNRMAGRNTLWILGTDHAGIATQSVVEKELRSGGHRRHELGREAFVERVWEWSEQYGVADHRAVSSGSAPPATTSDERFTLDEGYVTAVYRVFKQLLREGLHLPRQLHGQLGPGLALGDLATSRSRTARSTDTLYSIDYPVEGSDRVLTVATVRPETMLADTAVAVNPDDERYARPRRRATASCRWSAAGCRSSPTSTSTSSSAPAR